MKFCCDRPVRDGAPQYFSAAVLKAMAYSVTIDASETGTGPMKKMDCMEVCGSFHITPQPGHEPRPISPVVPVPVSLPVSITVPLSVNTALWLKHAVRDREQDRYRERDWHNTRKQRVAVPVSQTFLYDILGPIDPDPGPCPCIGPVPVQCD